MSESIAKIVQGSTAESPPAQTTGLQETWRKAVSTAFFGFFLDIYDVFLPVIILAPAYAYFKPDTLNSPVLDSFIVASALLGRPAGALLFGFVSDRLGRKKVAALSLTGSGLCVLLTALLPGCATIGILSIITLVTLRFLTGLFVGGQYTGAVTLAMEACPPRRRGFYGAFIGSSANLSFITIAVLGIILMKLMPPHGVGSAYVDWGWRIPFVLGAAMTFLSRQKLLAEVEESEQWLKSCTDQKTVGTILRQLEVGKIFQGFVLMNGMWLVYLVPAALVPASLRTIDKLSGMSVAMVMLVACAFTFIAYNIGGLISDRIGRRNAFVYQGIVAAVIGSALLYLLMSIPHPSVVTAGALESVIFFLCGLVWGSGPHSYLNERFHTDTRSSGYGIAFSFAIVIPAFFGVYQHALASIMPLRATPSVLLFIGAAITVAAALAGPETSLAGPFHISTEKDQNYDARR
jgi:MFS family permease